MKNLLFPKHFLLFATLLFSMSTFAQQPVMQYYATEQGLPASEVYDMHQDKNGYLWFATEFGVSRFDGYTFTNFTTKDGLAGNSTISIYEDRQGRIWFVAFVGGLSYYSNGFIKSHPENPKIREAINPGLIENIYIDSANVIWISRDIGTVFTLDPTGKITRHITEIQQNNNFELQFIDFGDGIISDINVFPKKFKYHTNRISQKDNVLMLSVHSENHQVFWRKKILKTAENAYLISYANQLYQVKNAKIKQSRVFENQISGLFVDNQGGFWISVMYEGIYYFETGNLRNTPSQFLEGTICSSVFQDFQNNFWLPTTKDGVYFMPSLAFKVFTSGTSNNIGKITSSNEALYYIRGDKSVYELSPNSNQPKLVRRVADKTTAFTDILFSKQNNIWITGSGTQCIDLTGELLFETSSTRGYDIFQASDDSIYITSGSGFLIHANNTMKRKNSAELNTFVQAIYKDKDNKVWLGTPEGLYVFRNNNFYFVGAEHALLQNRITAITQLGDKLLLTTSGEGLVIYSKDNIFNISEQEGLSSGFINAMHLISDTLAWLGTSNGLNQLRGPFTKSPQVEVTIFTVKDGLPSNEIKSIEVWQNHLWLGTTRGLVQFDPKKISKIKKYGNLTIDSVLVNNQIMQSDSIIINEAQHEIHIFFSNINFRYSDAVSYIFQLSGFDLKPRTTADKQVRYTNLPPGDYAFSLISSVKGHHAVSPPQTLQIRVPRSFQQTQIYFVLIAIAYTLIAGSVFYLIFITVQRRHRLQQQLLIAEQKALRAQMNPHFLFNSINSIQMYILENNKVAADNYLTRFSMLIRKVLDNSKHNLISMSTELETLELYLELEKMRFSDNFSYTIAVDPQLNSSEVKMPAMLIQPYLENAIWHGIMPDNKKGKISLSVKKADDILFWTIIDNGIGRVRANDINRRRKNHKSLGISNIRMRIKLMNKLYRKNITSQIVDLYDENGDAAGTKVLVYLPMNWQ